MCRKYNLQAFILGSVRMKSMLACYHFLLTAKVLQIPSPPSSNPRQSERATPIQSNPNPNDKDEDDDGPHQLISLISRCRKVVGSIGIGESDREAIPAGLPAVAVK